MIYATFKLFLKEVHDVIIYVGLNVVDNMDRTSTDRRTQHQPEFISLITCHQSAQQESIVSLVSLSQSRVNLLNTVCMLYCTDITCSTVYSEKTVNVCVPFISRIS